MPPQGSSDPRNSQLNARVRAGTKAATVQLAHVRDKEAGPYEDVTISTIVREYVRQGLRRDYNDLPEEAKDQLDDDLKADAGDGDEPVSEEVEA